MSSGGTILLVAVVVVGVVVVVERAVGSNYALIIMYSILVLVLVLL